MSKECENPFFFVQAVNKTKKNLMTSENEKFYNPFLTNKALGMFFDSSFFANEMNRAFNLPKRMQYDFYRLGLPKRNRYFGKWPKIVDQDKVVAISKYYNISYIKAEEALPILSNSKIVEILNRYNKNNELENKHDTE